MLLSTPRTLTELLTYTLLKLRLLVHTDTYPPPKPIIGTETGSKRGASAS